MFLWMLIQVDSSEFLHLLGRFTLHEGDPKVLGICYTQEISFFLHAHIFLNCVHVGEVTLESADRIFDENN